jgi:hypothetical protein
MQCPYCLGTSFQRGRFDLAQVVSLQPVLIRNVPGSRCRQCGYIQVNADTMKKIEEMVSAGLPDTMIASAVYDLASPLRLVEATHTPPAKFETSATKIAV